MTKPYKFAEQTGSYTLNPTREEYGSKMDKISAKYFSIVCNVVEESKDIYNAASIMITCLWDVVPCRLVQVS
jgi:hypothetical protein